MPDDKKINEQKLNSAREKMQREEMQKREEMQREEMQEREKMLRGQLQSMKRESESVPVSVQAEESTIELIINDYMKYMEAQGVKKEDIKKPKPDDNGVISLSFPSPEAAANFFLQQAEKDREFVVIDSKTNKVMAYSKGDGKLYHGDGKEFNKGDNLAACGVDKDQFIKGAKTPDEAPAPNPNPKPIS